MISSKRNNRPCSLWGAGIAVIIYVLLEMHVSLLVMLVKYHSLGKIRREKIFVGRHVQ